MSQPYRKKLIEVALPLDAINKEAAREKSIRHGHPSTLHLWWARRPLAACRAVLFASLVDDPSAHPDQFPTEEAQEAERQRLFRIIEELVKWENSDNDRVLKTARDEIIRSTDGKPPRVYDPFCGGGSIPVEAQRLGLEAHASDLNPLAVLITKALIEIPPKFAGQSPINPKSKTEISKSKAWPSSEGLAEDVRYYGQWIRDEAQKRISHLYPEVKLPKEYGGGNATVIAWLWARTVASPNPTAKGAHVPLIRSFWLSTKTGTKAWMDPIVDEKTMTYHFEIRKGAGDAKPGTVDRNGAVCLLTGSPITLEYIREEGRAGRMGTRLLAIVADAPQGRVYVGADEHHESIANAGESKDVPNTDLPEKALGFRVQAYGMTKHRHLFTHRQLIAITTFRDLVVEAHEKVSKDSNGNAEYARAVATYLAFAVDKMTDTNTTLCTWQINPPRLRATFGRQALPMTWDFAEANVFGDAAGDYQRCVGSLCEVLDRIVVTQPGYCSQADAGTALLNVDTPLISTDPPYYDNIGYADLSDFFYIWIRGAIGSLYPELFATVLVPKAKELVASPFRFGGDRSKAQHFFEEGLGQAFELVREAQSPAFPLSIYYAFKQSEESEEIGRDGAPVAVASTGWETMLEGLLKAGLTVSGTWPMRSELASRNVGRDTNALASSIVLVCRPRPKQAGIASRRDFLSALRKELPAALRHLQKGNIAPVDLAQAAIGPGMAVFSRYARVLESDGCPMNVRTALGLINQALDEVLTEQEGEFDSDTRWALAWFDQYGFAAGPYGVAETLSTAKNTSVSGMAEAGILVAKGGKVRLLRKEELAVDWDPATDNRFTIWEATHHLIRLLDTKGEQGTADLIARLGGGHSERAHDLTYRLYAICERRKWAKDAVPYNALVQAWSEASRLSALAPIEPTKIAQGDLL